MKVYCESDRADRAIARIITAVKTYAPPSIEFVTDESQADVVILYVYGFRRHTKNRIHKIQQTGKKYALVQLCLRSTPNPNTTDWLPLWESAEVVWSYYNLPELCQKDGNTSHFNFYYAPLGVDTQVFHETPSERKFIIVSTGSGSRFSQEYKNEVLSVAHALGKKVFHLGEGDNSEKITYSNGMDDTTLASYYSQSLFVSGLHKIESFELPVLEGLVCGARPICFDRSECHYWFKDLAEFIPEDTRARVAESVRRVFLKDARPVSQAEKKYVKSHFNWKTIVSEFWKKI